MTTTNIVSGAGVSVSVEHLYPIISVVNEVQQRVSMCVTLAPQVEILQEEIAVDVLCIIDVSSSMAQTCGIGDNVSRLNACIEALRSVTSTLSSCDRIGFVAFSDKVMDCMSFVRLTDEANVVNVKERMSKLRALGSTRFAPAFSSAKTILLESREDVLEERPRQIVVFITDGESTSGEDETPAIRDFANFLREQSIAFIAIGTGLDYKAQVLDSMAALVKGNSSAPHAQNMSQIQGYLEGEIAYAKGAQISDVSIKISATRRGVFLSEVVLLSHGCKELEVNDRRSCEVATGWLGHLRMQQLLLSFDVANVPAGVHEIAKINLEYRVGQKKHVATQEDYLRIECDKFLSESCVENPNVWKKIRMALAYKMMRKNEVIKARSLFETAGSQIMSRMFDDILNVQGRVTGLHDNPPDTQKLRSAMTLVSNATCFGTRDDLPKIDASFDPNVVASEIIAYREQTRVFWRTTCLKCGAGYSRGTLHCLKDDEMLFEILPDPRVKSGGDDVVLRIIPLKNVDRTLSSDESDRSSWNFTGNDFQKLHGQLYIGRPDLAVNYSPEINVSPFTGNHVSRQQALLFFDPKERMFSLQMLSENIPMYYRKSGETVAYLMQRYSWYKLQNADVLIIGNPKKAYAMFRIIFF